MDQTLVSYRLAGNVATISMDDGKSNALSPRMLGQLHAALDRAEHDRALVVLSGRPGVFSAGYDLRVLQAAGVDALSMLRAGLEVAERLLAFPTPTVAACGGHAIAMGAFLLLCCDYRLGVSGPFKITANEVAMGLPVPRVALAICRQRLTPAHFHRALVLAEIYSPELAIEAGFLDRVVPEAELQEAVQARVAELGKLDMRAHALTKRSAQSETLRTIRGAITADLATFVIEGARRFVSLKLSSSRNG